jgi:hypothetical protein
MYSNFRFELAKSQLVNSYLANADADGAKQAKLIFLRSILSAAAKYGRVTMDDVQRAIDHAIEHSGVMELSLEYADGIIADLCQIGDNYIGALSRQQAAELRRLRKLCILVAATGDQDALAQIADLL